MSISPSTDLISPSITIESSLEHTFLDDERKFFDDIGAKYVEDFPNVASLMGILMGEKPDIKQEYLIDASKKLAEIWRIKYDEIVSIDPVINIPLAQRFYEKQVDLQHAKHTGVEGLQKELVELKGELGEIEAKITDLEKIPENEREKIQEKKLGTFYEARRGFYKEIKDMESLIEKTRNGIKPDILIVLDVNYRHGGGDHYVRFVSNPTKDMSKYMLGLISESFNIERF